MIKVYAIGAAMVVFLIGVVYIQHLQKENKQLTLDLVTTKSLLVASENQVIELSVRDQKKTQVENSYEKNKSELKNKKNGPVADVLRYAIDTDLVRP